MFRVDLLQLLPVHIEDFHILHCFGTIGTWQKQSTLKAGAKCVGVGGLEGALRVAKLYSFIKTTTFFFAYKLF